MHDTIRLPARDHGAGAAGPFAGNHYAVRGLLYSSILTSGLLLVNAAGVTPADAAACSTAANFANSTFCIGGTSTAGLTYVGSNPLYTTGDFTLKLEDHTVNAAAGQSGISFNGVSVGNTGTINVSGSTAAGGSHVNSGSGADGIGSSANGSATVINIGQFSTVTGANFGIYVISSGANASITVNTDANTTVNGNDGNGIFADATGTGTANVKVDAQGTVTGKGTNAVGIDAHAASGTVTITTGTKAITGDGMGIQAASDTSTVSVTTGTGDVAGKAGNGINATAAGATTVDAHSNVTGTGGNGIRAISTDGKVTVTTTTNTTVSGTTSDGIHADATNTGDVEVTANSTTQGHFSGISANANAGTVKVTTGTAATSADDGTGIRATASGAITVDAHGNVTGTDGVGISALAENGDINVTTAENTTVTGTSGAGIHTNANVTGNVEVTAKSAVTGGTNGIDAFANAGTVKVTTGTAAISGAAGDGIHAIGPLGTTVDAKADVTGTGGSGINALSTNGAVSVTTAATKTVKGTADEGIHAGSTLTGNVEVNAQSIVQGSTNGINAFATAGTVKVTTGTGAVTGGAGDGVIAAASDASSSTVETHGSAIGTGGNGINATSGGGNVEVTTNEPTIGFTEVAGTGGAGIKAGTTGTGTVTITNDVTTSGTVAGIDVSSGTGAIQITNNDTIRNYSANLSGLAIRTTGGPTTIDNNGTITGRVETGGGIDVLNNNLGWITHGTSDFGGSNDVVNNTFGIVAAYSLGLATTTTFANLENLNNNAGGIQLADQNVGDGSNISDVLRTSGNYAGNGGGLSVDAFLGGAGSLADLLSIGGNATGATLIFVNDTNAGPGAYNPTGITVVHVDGTSDAATFALANGPIDKGLFVYDLLFDQPNQNYVLVGLPGRGALETTAVVSSNQEIWRETADAWSTRQENLRDVLAGSHGVTAVADPSLQGSDAPTGSFWMSALGSWTERDHDQSVSLLDSSFEFDTGYKQNIYGLVGGADFRANAGEDTSFLFGVMGGYVNSKLDFDNSSTSIDTDGVTVGAYMGLWSGGFFANALVKGDLLSLDYKAGIDDPDDADKADANSVGARGDIGYRFGDAGLFVEPTLSLDAIWTKVDRFSIGGSDVDAGTNESFRGGAGVRAGFGGETFGASATARVWDVFSTDNEVDILSVGPALGLSDDDLEGVYGDVSGQVDVSLTSNTTIYLKGGVLFSDDVTKPNASGGFAFYW